jgi:hypothetical protein
VLIWLAKWAAHIAQHVDQPLGPSSVGIHIYRAIQYNLVYVTNSPKMSYYHLCYCLWPKYSLQALIWLSHWATHVAWPVDWFWDPSSPEIHIYRAIHCNLVYMTKCLIIICTIACDLNKARKHLYDRSMGLPRWPDPWSEFGIHPVQGSIFPEQYIVILYIWQNVLLSFVLLPVT